MLGLGQMITRGGVIGGIIAKIVAALKGRASLFGSSAALKSILNNLKGLGLLDSAVVVTTPTAYSTGILHSVKPVDAPYADFTFTRASSGTRINEQGLVELMGANIPRFTWEGGKPSLLLEPQSTNLISYSEDISDAFWAKTRTTPILSTELSPDGITQVYEIRENTDSNHHSITASWPATIGNSYTYSFFFKPNGRNSVRVRHAFSGWDMAIKANLENGVILGTSGSVTSSKVTKIGDFYRVEYTVTAPSTATIPTFIFLDPDDVSTSASGNPTYVGDGVSGAYIWGVQVEQLPYATSYIPTAGTTVTRSADVCNNADVSTVVNSVEGVLYAEFYYDANVSSFPGIRMRTLDDQQQVSFYVFNGTLTYYVKSNNVNTVSNTYSVTPKTTYKIAIKYKLNDTVFFVNGTKIATDTVCEMPTSLTDLRFETSGNSMNYRALKVFNRALTDQELIDLTTI